MISLLDCEFTTSCNTNPNFTVSAQYCKNILEDHLLFSQSISGHSSVSAEILILRFPDFSIFSCQEGSIRADKQILEIASPASLENIYVNMRWWNIWIMFPLSLVGCHSLENLQKKYRTRKVFIWRQTSFVFLSHILGQGCTKRIT